MTLLRAEVVAEMLDVTPSWVRRAAREEDLPAVYLGRHVRFRRESIEEYIAAKERKARV